MRLSVIIAAKNSEQNLPELLKSLSRQEVSEVVVADGGSTDSTIPVARQFGADCTRVPDGNLGMLWNAGVRLTSNPISWFLLAETQIPGDSASRILDYMEECDGEIGGVFRTKKMESASSILHVASDAIGRLLPAQTVVENGLFLLRSSVYELGGFQESGNPMPDLCTRAEEIGSLGIIRQTISWHDSAD